MLRGRLKSGGMCLTLVECPTIAETARDSRGMDVMGTLDLSIQGWFINPDDIVRTLLFCLYMKISAAAGFVIHIAYRPAAQCSLPCRT